MLLASFSDISLQLGHCLAPFRFATLVISRNVSKLPCVPLLTPQIITKMLLLLLHAQLLEALQSVMAYLCILGCYFQYPDVLL